MIFSSLMLLLVAAFLHAVSNALLKQARDKLAFSWWMLGIFCIVGAPALFSVPTVEPIAWAFVVASGLLEAVYFLTLARAYTHGDLSIVYPVARGSAQLFVLIWATLLLGERPSALGLFGIFIIIAGLYLINLPSLSDWKRPLPGFRTPASRWALLTGILISGYTVIDKVGVGYFPPFIYLYLILVVCWIVLSLQWLAPDRRVPLLEEVRNQNSSVGAPGARSIFRNRITYVFAASILGTLAYLLVLFAMRLSPVSYVAPVREVSVVFGAWIGIRLLSESGGSLRIVASVFVAAGILLIAFRG